MKKAILAALGILFGAMPAHAQQFQSVLTMEPEASTLVPVAQVESDISALGLSAQRLKANNAMMFSAGEMMAVLPSERQISLAAATECGSSITDLKDGWKIFAYNLDRNAALALNLFGPMDLSASDKIIVYHFMWYKDIFDSENAIVGRCGAGVELVLKTSSLNASVEITLPAIAASTQLGQSQVQYSLSTFGVSGSAINAAIPQASAVGKFDTQAYAVLMGAIDKVQLAGQAGANITFTPRLVAMPGAGATAGEVDEALIRVTALRQIARGASCSAARAAVPNRSSTTDGIVDNFYRGFTRPNVCSVFGAGVNQSERQRAAASLTGFGLPVN